VGVSGRNIDLTAKPPTANNHKPPITPPTIPPSAPGESPDETFVAVDEITVDEITVEVVVGI
jgi:hypothetical protein